jgi:hypothetical protein
MPKATGGPAYHRDAPTASHEEVVASKVEALSIIHAVSGKITTAQHTKPATIHFF